MNSPLAQTKNKIIFYNVNFSSLPTRVLNNSNLY